VRLNETSYGALDPTVVRTCYAEGKRFGEALCTAWFHEYRLPTYIVRPFHTYGPGLQPDDGRVFADFAFNVIRGENIVMTSDGSARRAFCYVTDAIAGFFTVLLTGNAATAYNVANSAADLSLIEFAELLINLYPEKRLVVERRKRPSGSTYVPSSFSSVLPDTSRLAALGWCASVDPLTGFRRMIEAYGS
jgi:dTDP-glucose 4,6-dehydratase